MTTLESPSLRERKKAAVRQQLIAVASRLFRTRGFEATTIDEIAAGAHVARRTFFRYFDSKQTVVFAEYGARLQRFRSLLDGVGNESAFASARRASLTIAREYVLHRRELVAQWRLVQSSPLLVAHELELDRGWLSALVERFEREMPAFEARVIAGATLGVTRAVLREWFESDGKLDLIALGEQAFDVLARGTERKGEG